MCIALLQDIESEYTEKLSDSASVSAWMSDLISYHRLQSFSSVKMKKKIEKELCGKARVTSGDMLLIFPGDREGAVGTARVSFGWLTSTCIHLLYVSISLLFVSHEHETPLEIIRDSGGCMRIRWEWLLSRVSRQRRERRQKTRTRLQEGSPVTLSDEFAWLPYL